MGKGASRLELITQQNELLKEQNDLLREQNALMKRSASTNLDGEREVFIDNIDRDEMRSGFLVTSHRKKLWNVQIGLIQEFARICKKYNLRWFAIGGTLIGAARHKGFIPWDDDVDILMFRPDYEKFKRLATTELKEPYFLDLWCNYRLESESSLPGYYDNNPNLQSVTLEAEKKKDMTGWVLEWPKIKIRDSRTSQILRTSLNTINQGVWIDVFPLDPVPPFENNQQSQIFAVAKELHMAAMFPAWIKNAMSQNVRFVLSYDELNKFISNPLHVRGAMLDNFMEKNFFTSSKTGRTVEQFLSKKIIAYTTADFDKITYLPFEKIEVPAPAGYDGVLTSCYGDWRKMLRSPSHMLDYSADISFKDYFENVKGGVPTEIRYKFDTLEDVKHYSDNMSVNQK